MAQRKMAFYEVGKYETNDGPVFPLAVELQEAFESIQKKAEESGTKVALVLKIESSPRKSKKDSYGEIQYSIQEQNPARKSIKFTTKLSDDGIIIEAGDSRFDIEQLCLEFPKTFQLKQSNEE